MSEVVEINLDLPTGRPPPPVEFFIRGPLCEADWLGDRAQQQQPLLRLRASHHNLARLLAEGTSPGEAAALVGMCPSRVSVLQNDPAFRELMTFYAGRRDELLIDVNGRLKALTLDAIEVLHERVREAPEEIPTKDLQAAIDSGLDRIGFAKASKVLNLSVELSAQEFADMRNEAGLPPTLSRKEYLNALPSGDGAARSITGVGGTEEAATPVERSSGEGTDL